jgi:dihydropteroate synthase
MAKLMGIVNVTPDSFSDGGLYLDPERAIAHGHDLANEGAEILDVGGESLLRSPARPARAGPCPSTRPRLRSPRWRSTPAPRS